MLDVVSDDEDFQREVELLLNCVASNSIVQEIMKIPTTQSLFRLPSEYFDAKFFTHALVIQ